MSDTPHDTDDCPECGGAGEVRDGKRTRMLFAISVPAYITCGACEGRGWVWVNRP